MGDANVPKKGAPGPLLGTIWWVLTVSIVAYVASCIDCTGKFIQEPTISINLNFPAKKKFAFCHLSRKVIMKGLAV